ncbi:MAG: FtsX-like permease family protein [Chromatiales bacterium]|nr:FtsX-like permease family protein [Chromatiales bacterium]
MLMHFAFRNLWRHRQRTFVTIAAMGLAGSIMIFYSALMEGMLFASERNAISMNSGEMQLHVENYRRDPDLYKRIDGSYSIINKLQQAGFNASPRLYGFALAAAGTASSGVKMSAIDIDYESKVTKIHNHVMRGSWLSKDLPNDVVIGRRLARTLGVDVGDEVVIVGQAADGSMADALFNIRGILKSVGEEIDRAGFYMNVSTFRELMVIPEGSHEIVIMPKDGYSNTLNERLEQVRKLVPQLELLSWKKLLPAIAEILDMTDASIVVMILITYIAVGMVILNAMLMGVFERIREFGVMKALGFSPWQIFSLILLESQIQVALASMITIGVGIPLSLYFSVHGIDLSQFTSGFTFGGVALDPHWRSMLTPQSVIMPVGLLFAIATLAVIYPAIKAAVIQPIEAIHHQ